MKPDTNWLLAAIWGGEKGKIFLVNLLAQFNKGIVPLNYLKEFFSALADQPGIGTVCAAHHASSAPVFDEDLSEQVFGACYTLLNNEMRFATDVYTSSPANMASLYASEKDALCNVVTLKDLLDHYIHPDTLLSSLSAASVTMTSALVPLWEKVAKEMDSGAITADDLNRIAPAAIEKKVKENAPGKTLWRTRLPFFWLAPLSEVRDRLSADTIRDKLGIMGWKINHYLIDIRVKLLDPALLTRTTAFNALDNPRYKGLTNFDHSPSPLRDWSGRTADLAKFANGDADIEGYREVVCKQINWSPNLAVKFHFFGALTKERGTTSADGHLAFMHRLAADYSLIPAAVIPQLSLQLA